MVRDLDVAFDVLLAGRDIREHRGQQIVGTHALDLRRNFLAALKTQQCEGTCCIPAPAGLKNGSGERRLLQNRRHGFRVQEMKNIGQRETVLLGQRDVQTVVSGRRLKFEIKSAAKTLAQRETPCLVDAASERGVYHQLHPAALVEEALSDDRRLRRHVTQNSTAFEDVLDQLLGACSVKTALFS